MELKGKVVLVTGASSGIGRELSRLLARRGARLALVARGAEALRALAAELAAGGAEAAAFPADVTDRSAVAAAVAGAAERFGGLDVLVNCAGMGYFGPIETMSAEDIDRVVRTNVHGLLYFTQACLPALIRARGMVVNISSGLAMRALPFLSVYAGTKSMVNAISDGLRLELAPRGVRVIAYCPPATDTGFDAHSPKGPGMDAVGFGGMRTADVRTVAAGILAAMERERRRVGGGFFLVMNALAPRMLDRMFAGMVKRFTP
jgi:short-subunit dehydrogenase